MRSMSVSGERKKTGTLRFACRRGGPAWRETDAHLTARHAQGVVVDGNRHRRRRTLCDRPRQTDPNRIVWHEGQRSDGYDRGSRGDYGGVRSRSICPGPARERYRPDAGVAVRIRVSSLADATAPSGRGSFSVGMLNRSWSPGTGRWLASCRACRAAAPWFQPAIAG